MLVVNGLAILRKKNLKQTPNGTDVFEGFISFKTSKKNNDGKYDWSAIGIVAFGKTAFNIDKNIDIGETFVVQNGELRSDEWTDKNGSKRTKHTVFITQIAFVPGGNKNKKQSTPKYADDNAGF